jgi:DNA-directed RNA polymerase specialized sigma24 family protein
MSIRKAARLHSGRAVPATSVPTSQRVVRETITAMGGQQRLILALYFYENLGPATIAKTLGAPLGEVERLLDRGRAEVARALAPTDRSQGTAGRHVA